MLGRQIELLGDETYIVPLYYHIVDNFQIQFRREEFCLVTGLSFGVEYSDDYDNDEDPIPFRRRMFSSSLDGILQFVLLGLEDRRRVPDWIFRDANVRHWPNLYATEASRDVDKKTYSMFGFTWTFKVMSVGLVRQPNTRPIVVDQHYGLSDFSEFQSMQGGPSSFPTQGNNSFFEGDQATPSYGHNMATLNWQTPMPSHPAFNLRNAFDEDNVRGDNLMFLGEHDTGHCLVYENVDPSKVRRGNYIDCMEFMLNPYDVNLDCHMMGYMVPDYFWRQLVPHLCMPGSHSLELVYMPINAEGNHWVTGAIDLMASLFYFEQSPFLEDPPEYIGGVEGPREKVGADEVPREKLGVDEDTGELITLLRHTPLPEYPTRDFTMSTSSLQAKKNVGC
ncbi:hypothetical protein Tco_1162455, partial [Tanacetum coccineum]